jgi:predicted ATPase/class 3 adenylate cyclase/DNA-binding CsgD family transcriptional regulator
MTEIDAASRSLLANWSNPAMSESLPVGTVTLLLADVEGSTRRWEAQPEEMTAAVARLDQTVSGIVAAHAGVRPVEQGEGDSFVAAFTRASDAVACALDLQRAPLAPIRLRIGVHTGEAQLRDEGNYIGPTVNRAARLRDLAHGGQTVVSGTVEDLVADRLPADAWLVDLGTHRLRDLPRPVRVVQLCHPEVRVQFPPLRTRGAAPSRRLPVQLTSFVGRGAQVSQVRRLVADSRLVTVTGAGGAGKTRLAVRVAAMMAADFADGIVFVDLGPITETDGVAAAVARALNLPDQPGRTTMDAVAQLIGDQQMLMMLDNCEHLLDASAEVAVALLAACPRLAILATSREPLAVAGEVSWRVPPLSLTDEALELFGDRARDVQPDFTISEENSATVTEICRRLDGLPLPIELAAARVRSLSLAEIVDGLTDRFYLLTGGARTAVQRQQTLWASVDWSYGLLAERERTLFRRLAVFKGGFDIEAARAVADGDEVERYEVLNPLAALVDKSLVVAETSSSRTRYRLLETMRQYALDRLDDAGETAAVRSRHRDHYIAVAARLDHPARSGHERQIEKTDRDFANFRAAFRWCRDNGDNELALTLASSLQPLWLGRGHIQQGLTWLDTVLTDEHITQSDVAPAVWARGLADKAVLCAWIGDGGRDHAQQALAIARGLDDPALLARALTACGAIAGYDLDAALPYLDEAARVARAVDDRWRLSRILGWQAYGSYVAGDPVATRDAADEGRHVAEAIGDRLGSRYCRWSLAMAAMIQGDLDGAVVRLRELVAECHVSHDVLWRTTTLISLARALAHHGDASAAVAAAKAAIDSATQLGGWYEGFGYAALTVAALSAGDVAGAEKAITAGKPNLSPQPAVLVNAFVAQVAHAGGDLDEARRLADEAVSATAGWHRSTALTTRARVAAQQGDFEQAERDAHDALTCSVDVQAYLGVPDTLECLAALGGQAGNHRQAARLLGAADAVRQGQGEVRFAMYDAGYKAALAVIRDGLGDEEFEIAWAEGAALPIDEAVAYAQRGRGERRRPTSGWGSLTPAEHDVVRLVREGLSNKDIAARLFVSPRTVQSHLAHIYAKLGIHSRLQLAQEASRQAGATEPTPSH